MNVSQFELVRFSWADTRVCKHQNVVAQQLSALACAIVLAVLMRLHNVHQSRRYSQSSNAGLTRFFFGVKVALMGGLLPRKPCSWAHFMMTLPSILSH